METCFTVDKYQLQYVNIILSTIAKASIINIKWYASNLKSKLCNTHTKNEAKYEQIHILLQEYWKRN